MMVRIYLANGDVIDINAISENIESIIERFGTAEWIRTEDKGYINISQICRIIELGNEK